MDTKIITIQIPENNAVLKKQQLNLLKPASDCLAKGGLVAFPTETVYGLGADGLSGEAVARIYEAKGRHADNPLILHITRAEELNELAYVNDRALILAQAFWPGPLTIVLPKRDIVPNATTGGLETVAVRMPSHPAALELIEKSGVYVAAPSANASGRPSPTTAGHVMEDMKGKIDIIVDAGEVGIGIESTIVDVSNEIPVILRPGFITKTMLEQVIGNVKFYSEPSHVAPALAHQDFCLAPGMKYTHYAPKGELSIVEPISKSGVFSEGDMERAIIEINYLSAQKRKEGYKTGILATAETYDKYKADLVLPVGERSNRETVAAKLYAALRKFDYADIQFIYSESFQGDDLGHAIMNRLLKAAGNRIIKI